MSLRILAVENLSADSARRGIWQTLASTGKFDVHLLVPQRWRESGAMSEATPDPGGTLRVHTTRTLFGFRQHRVLYRGLFGMVREVKPDLLYMEMEPENYAAVQALYARRMMSNNLKLCLVSSRMLDLHRIGYPYTLSFTHRFSDRLAVAHPADLLVVRTRITARLMQPYAHRLALIPHAVDCTRFHPSPSQQEGGFVVGYFGRLIAGKGIQVALKALARLPARVHMKIVGDGPEKPVLLQLAASLGIGHRVDFLPPVPYAAMPAALHGCDTLVLPSLETRYWVEQFGRVLIEAMACGIPVVASSVGGIPDVVADAGLLFRQADVEELVSRLSSLIENESLRIELGKRGRERAQKYYNVPVVAEAYATAFRGVLS